MIVLSVRKFKLIIIGIILFLLVAERLYFLSGAETAPASPAGTWRISKSKFPRKTFVHNGQLYEVRSFGMYGGENNLTVIFDPGNPEKAYINSFGEVWAVRIIFHLLAIVIWEVFSSIFIDRNDAIELSRFKLRIIRRQQKAAGKPAPRFVPPRKLLNRRNKR